MVELSMLKIFNRKINLKLDEYNFKSIVGEAKSLSSIDVSKD